MSRSTPQVRVFSAPSKAMVAGGYLVLDPNYRSFVTALSCRMHARIETLNLNNSLDHNGTLSYISVSSPQFGGKWIFTIDADLNIQETTGCRNPFLEAAIRCIIGFCRPASFFSYQITLFSDPGYHTQEGALPRVSSTGKRSFLYHEKPIEKVPKTGMGLSAGLVTVITASLLTTMLDQSLEDLRDTIHKVAQIAHCDAQGKIGSGFDVATAVYGSIVYRRYKPEVISSLLGRTVSEEFVHDIRATVESDWDFVNTPCSLPPGIKLLMGDVKSGSETPKLVSKVLAWRKEDPHSAEVYAELDSANESFMRELSLLDQAFKADPSQYWDSLSQSDAILEPLKFTISAIRSGLQKLTAKSGADVEPAEQTKLLNRCALLPGCLGGVVPGAGGYDAICIFVRESEIESFKEKSFSLADFDGVSWLDLAEESRGLVEEVAAEYGGL